jgi:subtilisin family serine protease
MKIYRNDCTNRKTNIKTKRHVIANMHLSHNILRFALFSLFFICISAYGIIEPSLLERMENCEPDQKLSIDIVLTEQFSNSDLLSKVEGLPKPQRRAEVAKILREYSSEKQQSILNYLYTKEVEDEVSNIVSLWLCNMVSCYAIPKVILELDSRNDVSLIFYDRVPIELELIEKNNSTPSDALGWNVSRVKAPQVWQKGYKGVGIVVGIIDTGVRYTHRDLQNHLWISDAYPNHGFNFGPGDSLVPADYNGHGTKCAGIIASDGSAGETCGVAPCAKIMAVAVDLSNPDTVHQNQVMQAMQFCVSPPNDPSNGADVISMSLGWIQEPDWSPSYETWRISCENILAAGIIAVVGAGNERGEQHYPPPYNIRIPGACPPPYPHPQNGSEGSLSCVITVGATAPRNDEIAHFSSEGPSTWQDVPPWYDYPYPPGLTDPDISAPGVDIMSLDWRSDSTYLGTSEGTSFATPHIAGAIALMLSKNNTLFPRQIDSILEHYGCIDLGEPGKDNDYGAGRLDCESMIHYTPIRHLATERATFPNQGKHLVHAPNTSNLYKVFENNDRIFYSSSNDWGQNWTTPICLCEGRNPAITIGTQSNLPWIFFYKEDCFVCKILRPDGMWKERAIFYSDFQYIPEDWSIGPSIVMATIRGESNLGDLAYAVVSDRFEQIRFIAFDTVNNYCGEQIIDDYYPCLAPSISITPADLLHIVWQRDIEDGKIFYKTTLEKVHPDDIRQGIPPNWSEIIQISMEYPWPTEPASNPSTEAYGEYVYAAWRGPYDENNPTGEIWRRARWLPYEDPTRWEDPRNMSETQNTESNYPVMSTNFVTVWQEQVDSTNWDIWGKFAPEPLSQPFFETEKPSKFPHITNYINPKTGEFNCYTIWTEEINDPVYEVKFGNRSYIPRKSDSGYDFSYYNVNIGESIPSYYCVERTGYQQYNHYKIDFGDQKLKYKLPYLHPSYYYDLRAIIYQQGQDNWSQEFDIDSALSTTVTFEPNRPETIWIRLPQQSYKNDAKVKHEIKKILGNRAVIADLRLYQIEVFDDSTGGGSGPQSACNALIQRPILYQSYPNPAKMQTVIRYSLPVSGKVSLSIYDISGRTVRHLVNEDKESGIYSVNWDGKDYKGRSLSQGVYFYHLKTDGFSDIKRLVLIR